MRSRSSLPSYASSSLDLVVTSCGLTLQICLIIASHWRFGFVNGQVSLAWTTAANNTLYFDFFFSREKRLDLLCEPSARQMINMKCFTRGVQ